jgi:hypothetical protein
MRIDLFTVWFMNGLLSKQSEQKAVFKMVANTSTTVPDSQRVPTITGYVAEASPL